MNVERISQHVERVANPGGFDRIRRDGRLVGYICEMDDLGEVLASDPDACDLVAAISGLNCEEFSACFDAYGEAMDFAAGLLR